MNDNKLWQSFTELQEHENHLSYKKDFFKDIDIKYFLSARINIEKVYEIIDDLLNDYPIFYFYIIDKNETTTNRNNINFNNQLKKKFFQELKLNNFVNCAKIYLAKIPIRPEKKRGLVDLLARKVTKPQIKRELENTLLNKLEKLNVSELITKKLVKYMLEEILLRIDNLGEYIEHEKLVKYYKQLINYDNDILKVIEKIHIFKYEQKLQNDEIWGKLDLV